MVQDIHFKAYAKTRKEGIYFALETFGETVDLYDGRCYDLFSAFGSLRSSYPEIGNIEYGIPEFLPESVKEYLNHPDWHTMSYWSVPRLKHEIELYMEKLKNPGLFIMDGEFTEKTFEIKEFSPDYFPEEEKESIYSQMDGMRRRLEYLENDYDWLGKYVDPDTIVIMIYFDN